MFRSLSDRTAFFIVVFALIGIIQSAADFNALPRGYAQNNVERNDLQASNGTQTFSNAAPIALNDATVAAPYPAGINVSGVGGTIEKLTVTLNNFGHSFPDDVDVLLVAPGGQTIVLMSDSGGGFNATGVNLTFDDSAAGSLLDSDLIEAGTYKPTNYEQNDNFPQPAPQQISGTALSIFNGANPNGVWNLYVVDDAGQDAGIIAGGWSLTISNGVTGQNPAPLNIPDSGAASVYPSGIKISGQNGTVVGVRVLINNLSHAAPNDVDLLLVAPNNRSLILMSDAGGNKAVNNVSLIFDDAAATSLPDDGQIFSGAYKPTNIGGGDSFPPPAPSNNPTGADLSIFNGTNPNGVWNLYLVDDSSGNAGIVTGGWSLALKTSPTACPISVFGTQVFSQNGGAGNFSVSTPPGCEWTVKSQTPDVIAVQNESGNGNGVVSFTVLPNAGEARTGALTISNNNYNQTFTIQQASGCPFALAQETQSFAASGGAGQVAFTAAIGCYWTVSSNSDWLRVTSHADGAYGSSVVTFVVAPNGTNQPRTGIISVGARTLTVTQDAGGGCPYAVSENSQYAAFNGAGNAIAVLAGGSCNWTAASNVNWITINSGASGSGNGFVTYTAAPNNTNAARTGTITVNNLSVTILQGRRAQSAPFDFDGDGKTDFAVFRPTNGVWYISGSSDNKFSAVQFGLGTDRLAAADYDGDRKTDIAVFRQGSWFVLNSSTNTMQAVNWGIAGDAAAPGDYDGDGRADYAVFRPSQETWYVLLSATNVIFSQRFGAASDAPAPADYDGDGKTDFVLYRAGSLRDAPSLYFIRLSSGSGETRVLQFGSGEDLPVAADYDADGRANFAVFRPSSGAWYRSQNPATNFDEQLWGAAGDVPVPGDYDADGKIDVAVFRRGVWYILNSSNNSPRAASWGAATDLPAQSFYKPNPAQRFQSR